MASGEDGVLVADYEGRILFQDKIGHAQRVSMGNYRPDLNGLETCAITYWRNASIITLYDKDFRRLCTWEHPADGNVITPVNWTGDGSDLILTSASAAHGGLYDGYGELAAPFPADDAHPELCCEAIQYAGGERDRLMAWDEERMFIYSQADARGRGFSPAPVKCPHYNGSNYRGEYAFR